MTERVDNYQIEVLYRNYLKQVKRSGVLDVDTVLPTTGGNLSEVLASSRSLARKEFVRVHLEMKVLFRRIRKIEKSIKKDINSISTQYPTYKQTWHEIFEEFEREIGDIFDYAQRTLIVSLDAKIKRMDNFTICLFGKTKAGKSTTMEALTCGKGETIGKGQQNTTLKAEEYQWNGLVVVDTPGIDSMQERQELETTALEYADGSDLILFLMPHQIEQAEFVQFRRFYKQNKPIVILLNIKADTGKPGTEDFEDFLKYASKEVFNESDVSGYQERINGFIFDTLDIPKGLVPIVPVHSLSAFMAHSKSNGLPETTRQKLFGISRFSSLEDRLIEEVQSYGELYRIKNPHDTLILFSKDIGDHFRSFSSLMTKQKEIFEANAKRFSEVVAKIQLEQSCTIKNTMERYFDSKRPAVQGIVDELFEAAKDEAKQKEILQQFMPERQVIQKVDEVQATIQSQIVKDITEFFCSFEQELRTIDIEAQKSKVGRMAGVDIKGISEVGKTGDLLKKMSYVSSIAGGLVFTISGVAFLGASGTIMGVGTANFWNPVGWGLMAVGIGLGIFGLKKKKEMKKKLQKAKADAVTRLSQAVDQAKNTVVSNLKLWVEQVLEKIQKEHIDVMAQYAKYAEKHLTEVDSLVMFLDHLNSKTQKVKFESMMRRFLQDDSLMLTEISEKDTTIMINLSSGTIRDVKYLEKVLSRVEEKNVRIVGRLT